VNESAALARFLEWLDRAIEAPDEKERGRAASAALLALHGVLRRRDPLVLSCDEGDLFIQGHDVQAEAGSSARLSRRLREAGIVSILFHAHVERADFLLLLAALRGEPGAPGFLGDPEGPLGEGRGIRVFALMCPVP
jgi:hypothetical protein